MKVNQMIWIAKHIIDGALVSLHSLALQLEAFKTGKFTFHGLQWDQVFNLSSASSSRLVLQTREKILQLNWSNFIMDLIFNNKTFLKLSCFLVDDVFVSSRNVTRYKIENLKSSTALRRQTTFSSLLRGKTILILNAASRSPPTVRNDDKFMYKKVLHQHQHKVFGRRAREEREGKYFRCRDNLC